MLFATFLSTFLLIKASAAAAIADSSVEDIFLTHDIVEMQWKFPTADSGFVYVNGTIEQALEQIAKNHPEVIPFSAVSDDENAGLAKRTDFSGGSFNCLFGNYGDCFKIGIQQGIEYLRGVSGQPHLGPGPGNCSRVSCAYGNAIFWCNDNLETKTLEGFRSIADGAQYLIAKCLFTNGVYVHGQVFHPTGWNVIVRHDSC